jgi:hypothetical protein
LFSSRAKFEHCAEKINGYLRDLGAVGFRAPLTIRHPEWMQALNLDYDLSFFDSDPFEPIPGGTMSIWPFFLGHFVELPYTLVQDYTLTDVLKEQTPDLWLKKVEFIREHYGMALINSHPDYLKVPARFQIYSSFLQRVRENGGYWHALPRDVAHWWRERSTSPYNSEVSIQNGRIVLNYQTLAQEVRKLASGKYQNYSAFRDFGA